MKKRYFLIVVLVTASAQITSGQTVAPASKINFTPAGDFYSGDQQSLLVVDEVMYRDGISSHFQKTEPSLAYNFIDAAHTGFKPNLNPDDIKEIKVRDRSAVMLLYNEDVNGAIIITTKKQTDK